MRLAKISIIALALTAPSAFAHHACPQLCNDLQSCVVSADWVLEADVAKFTHGARHQECETAPGSARCVSTESVGTLTLEHARLLRGSHAIDPTGAIEMQRKDTCFSGALAFMNRVEEDALVGQHVLVYGSDSRNPPFIKPGYFFIAPAL